MNTYEVVDNNHKVRHTVAAETYEINASRAAFWKTLGDYNNSHNPIVSVAVEPGWMVREKKA
jgi:hypothetical protein